MTTSRRSTQAAATGIRPPATRRPAMAGALLSATLGLAVLTGCGEDDTSPTTPADVDVRPAEDLEDPYDGAYTEEFRDDLEGYNGLEVSLVGEVERIVSPIAFTLAGTDGVEPILVVMQEEPGNLAPGQTVAVAAQPWEEFELAEVEEAIGADLPDEAYADWEGEPFLDATIVEPQE
ncbi:hypothetical protein [Blastococcus xanthinilyticus]|uniref:Uncharacterized protein n=1 Tax=Blastococcus xanthinilyticus TaxID=1564164 RepID=A0A5S5D687_9ACTN|nr:hypothetical protein [Blastococcus xanthinilyticus]TYP90292.1 hypothetical protein BD833_10110 [Blastococcus xanthinilyticus]